MRRPASFGICAGERRSRLRMQRSQTGREQISFTTCFAAPGRRRSRTRSRKSGIAMWMQPSSGECKARVPMSFLDLTCSGNEGRSRQLQQTQSRRGWRDEATPLLQQHHSYLLVPQTARPPLLLRAVPQPPNPPIFTLTPPRPLLQLAAHPGAPYLPPPPLPSFPPPLRVLPRILRF